LSQGLQSIRRKLAESYFSHLLLAASVGGVLVTLIWFISLHDLVDAGADWTRTVWQQLRSSSSLSWWAVVGSVVTAAIILRTLAYRAIEPQARLVETCFAMLGGVYRKRTDVQDGALGIFGRTINRLGEEVSQKLTELNDERLRLSAILGNLEEGVICLDADGRVLFLNHVAISIFAVSETNVRGKRIAEHQSLKVLTPIIECAKSEDGRSSSLVELTRDELATLNVEVQASRVVGESFDGYVVVARDVTRMRQLEVMRREFLGNVSHEFKTPLTAIRGYIETLQGDEFSFEPAAKTFLQRMRQSAMKMDALLSDIMHLERIENRVKRESHETTSLAEVVETVLRDWAEECKRKSIVLEVNLSEPDRRIAGDRESVQLILDNLVSNAVRYTNAGGKVEISDEVSDGRYAFKVCDSGIGIAPEHQARVFERFYRVDQARSRELGGTGLGLSIVKHVMKNLGGNISIASEVGVGSTFTVQLPLHH